MRVLALDSAADGVVRSFGVGTLDMKHPESTVDHPMIVLDAGGYVCGCECWWGEESKLRERLSTERGWRWEEIAAPHRHDEGGANRVPSLRKSDLIAIVDGPHAGGEPPEVASELRPSLFELTGLAGELPGNGADS